MSKDGTSEEVAATGGAGFTEAQLASIGGVVQGLLDKALRKDRPAGGDGAARHGGPATERPVSWRQEEGREYGTA